MLEGAGQTKILEITFTKKTLSKMSFVISFLSGGLLLYLLRELKENLKTLFSSELFTVDSRDFPL